MWIRIIAITVCALVLPACSTVSQFQTYRPDGELKNLAIEVLYHPGVPPRFEVVIDGQKVVEVSASLSHYEFSAAGTHNGNRVDIKGRSTTFRGFIIDIYYANTRAANFIMK